MLFLMSEVEDIAVTRFRQYLRIKTVQPKPDYPGCVEFLSKYANELGFAVEVVEPVKGKPFVLMTILGEDVNLPSILLYSHTDVVPVFPEHWTHDPFSADKDAKGNIYARGAQDMKCVGVQYMEALRRLKSVGPLKFKRTVHIMWGPDEEINGVDGMQAMVNTKKFKSLNIGFALDEGIASETDTYLVFNGERCIWWLKVICPGNPGHGSKFIENTAAEKLRKVVNSLLDFRSEQEKKLNTDDSLSLGDVITVNLTKLDGGVQLNVVPDQLCAYFDIRIPPSTNFEEFENRIKRWTSEAGAGVSYEFLQKIVIKQVTNTSADDPWWATLTTVFDQLKMKHKLGIFTGGTDARNLRKLDISAIGFSPMINTPVLLHDHNEYLNENVFLDGVKIYQKIIPALANVKPF